MTFLTDEELDQVLGFFALGSTEHTMATEIWKHRSCWKALQEYAEVARQVDDISHYRVIVGDCAEDPRIIWGGAS